MKKFKDLKITYDNLVLQIESMKKDTIKFTLDYNTINTKLKEKVEEYNKQVDKIKEEQHKNKVDINNFNKDFIKDLNVKKNRLNKLEYNLELKKQEQKLHGEEIDRLEIQLQNHEKICDLEDKKLLSKEKSLNKRSNKIDKQENLMIDKKKEFNKLIKEKTKNKDMLDEYIKGIRKEEKQIKEEQEKRLAELLGKQNILDIQENRLKEKEEKHISDMKELLSAKQSQNG